MNDKLNDTLLELLNANIDSNPALNRLLQDYTTYHLVLVLLGAAAVLALLALGVFFGMRFWRLPRGAWTFEKITFFSFSAASMLVSALLALIVAANLSNVVNPRHGFTLLAESLPTPAAGSDRARLAQGFNTWLVSADPHAPPTVQRAVRDRLAWQQPKAVVSSLLFVGLTLLSAWIWRSLLRRSRVSGRTWNARRVALLVSGVGSVGTSLLLLIMALANTQAAFAPITLTLQFG